MGSDEGSDEVSDERSEAPWPSCFLSILTLDDAFFPCEGRGSKAERVSGCVGGLISVSGRWASQCWWKALALLARLISSHLYRNPAHPASEEEAPAAKRDGDAEDPTPSRHWLSLAINNLLDVKTERGSPGARTCH